jgi:hypothetical protein
MPRIDAAYARVSSQPIVEETGPFEWYRHNADHVVMVVEGCGIALAINGVLQEPQFAETPEQALAIARELVSRDTIA